MRPAALLAFACSMAAAAPPVRIIEGAADSPVRVVIYEDLQCPDCADFRRMLDEKLLPRYGSKVAFEHRDFPLAKHAWARKAAIAGRFFAHQNAALGIEFRQFAMSNQKQIAADSASDTFANWAAQHKIDKAIFLAALDDPKLAAEVESDYQEGVARGIAHTPTALVNGQPFIETFTYEEISKAIDSELANVK